MIHVYISYLLWFISNHVCFLFSFFYLYYVLFIYYSQYSFVLFHLFSTFSFLFSFVRTMFFFSCHHLSIYYTDSKNNALSMSIMSFFRGRSRVFLLDPCLHFLFALVYFQSCLFSLFLLLLVLCIVYIIFSILFCFVSSIAYLFFSILIFQNYVFFFLPSLTNILYRLEEQRTFHEHHVFL